MWTRAGSVCDYHIHKTKRKHVLLLHAHAAELQEIETLSADVNGPDHPYTFAMAAMRYITLRRIARDAEKALSEAPATDQLRTDAALRTEAISGLEALLPRMKQHLGESHADTLWVMSELASDLQDRWKLARGTPAAEADRRRALELCNQDLGHDILHRTLS